MQTSRRALLASAAAGCSLAGCLDIGVMLSRNPSDYRFEPSAGWRMDGRTAARAGSNPDSAGPTGPVGTVWRDDPDADAFHTTAPVVVDETVYVGFSEEGDANGQYEASVAGFDARTGERTTTAGVGRGRFAGLALDDGVLYAGLWVYDPYRSVVLAVSPAGSVRWRHELAPLAGPPALHDGTLYVSTRQENAVYAFGRDGRQAWRTELGAEVENPPCVADGTVYVGLGNGSLVALDADTGEETWREPVAAGDACCPDIQGTPAAADGRLFVPGVDERVYGVDAADGSTLWKSRVVGDDYGNSIPSPAVAHGTVYVNTIHGGVVALDAADGTEVWRVPADGEAVETSPVSPPGVAGGTVVVPRHDAVRGFDADGTESWRVDLEVPDAPGSAAYIMQPEIALAHGVAYVALHDRRVLAVGAPE